MKKKKVTTLTKLIVELILKDVDMEQILKLIITPILPLKGIKKLNELL